MARLRSSLLHFARDKRGTSPERWAIIAGGVGVACVLGTHVLDLAIRNGAVPQIAFRADRDLAISLRKSPDSTVTTRQQTAAGIDYTATASIPASASTVHLDPCTGLLK